MFGSLRTHGQAHFLADCLHRCTWPTYNIYDDDDPVRAGRPLWSFISEGLMIARGCEMTTMCFLTRP